MEFGTAKAEIEKSILRKEMAIVVGSCTVQYNGRASSTLGDAKRLVMLKGDNSVSVHQNRLVRAVNYMVNAKSGAEIRAGMLVLKSAKTRPKESMEIDFSSIDHFSSFPMHDSPDIRLSGSELELSKQLSDDLSVI